MNISATDSTTGANAGASQATTNNTPCLPPRPQNAICTPPQVKHRPPQTTDPHWTDGQLPPISHRPYLKTHAKLPTKSLIQQPPATCSGDFFLRPDQRYPKTPLA
ncbi:MAG: hypothetical protein OXC07_09400 [Kistimonas sp.]|nr:hypothetical protein [Kistimonas sp.]